MEQLRDIFYNIFNRSLSNNPAETAAFFILLTGFFGSLVLINIYRTRKIKRKQIKSMENKWNVLCRRFELTNDEADFIEDLSSHMQTPEKKYLLLVNPHLFTNCLKHYSGELDAGNMEEAIIRKTGLIPVSEQMKGIVTHRRKNYRKHIDIEAEICPIEYVVANRKTRMFDISHGGCMVENTDKRFKPGDDLKLSFTLEKKTYRDVPAEVVRVSSANKILHLKFIR